MANTFGHKLRKLREARGISQTEFARRLGYSSNGYISDIENGAYLPREEEKLRGFARVLDVSYGEIRGMALESRLEGMGIGDPGFVSMFKDYARLTQKDRQEIVRAYLKVKSKRKPANGRDH